MRNRTTDASVHVHFLTHHNMALKYKKTKQKRQRKYQIRLFLYHNSRKHRQSPITFSLSLMEELHVLYVIVFLASSICIQHNDHLSPLSGMACIC